MNRPIGFALFFALVVPSVVFIRHEGLRAQPFQAQTAETAKMISAEDCTPARLGTDIPVAAIGAAAGILNVSPGQIRVAVRYYGAYPDEIDERVRRNFDETDAAEAAWEREQAALA